MLARHIVVAAGNRTRLESCRYHFFLNNKSRYPICGNSPRTMIKKKNPGTKGGARFVPNNKRWSEIQDPNLVPVRKTCGTCREMRSKVPSTRR